MTWDNLARRVLYYAAYALYTGLRPPKPAPFTLIVSDQEKTSMGLVFKVSVSLPPLPADDTLKAQKLRVAVNGGPAEDVPVTLADGTVDLPKRYRVGDQLQAALSYVDEADNEGAPRVVDLTVTDTFAPAMPGVFGLAVTGQEFVPDTLPGGNG